MSVSASRNSPRLISILVLLMLLIIISLVFLSIVFKYNNEKRSIMRVVRMSATDVVNQHRSFVSNRLQMNENMKQTIPLLPGQFVWPDSLNLIKNGSFSENNSYFETDVEDLKNNNSLLTNPQKSGISVVTTSAAKIHWNWEGESHDQDGKMFVVDGPVDSNIVIWKQTVNVKPGRKYILQFYFSNLSHPKNNQRISETRWQRAFLQPCINDSCLPSAFAPEETQNWMAYKQIWYSDKSDEAVITLYNRNTAGMFNDFGIDDISLTEATEENLSLAGKIPSTAEQPPYGNAEDEQIFNYLIKDYNEYRNYYVDFTVIMLSYSDNNNFENLSKVISSDKLAAEEYLKNDLRNTSQNGFTTGDYYYTAPCMYDNNAFIVIRINNLREFLYGRVLDEFFLFIIIIIIAVIMYIIIIRFLKSNLELTMLKYTIINNVNHEIKTPVAVILAATEALEKYSILDNKEKTLQYLRMTRVQAERINTLIDKSLQTYAIEEDDFQLQLEQIYINDLLQEVANIWDESHPDQLLLELELPENECVISGDKFHLTNILNTLIDNAVKHSGMQQVRVWLSMEVRGKFVTITVGDNGPGIPQKHQKDVFEKFFQVPLEGDQKSKGYGLGLHYVKTITELHKGNVSLISDGVCGTDIQLQLPIYAQTTAR
ncbi:MAG: sensor histidine kinase [Bacteroidota bacterium]